MNYFITIIFALFCLLRTQTCFAQQTINVSGLDHDTMVYAPNAELLADAKGIYNAENILKAQPNFKPFLPGDCSAPEINNYWLRTKIKSDADGKWLLEFLDPHIHQVTIYEKIGEKLVQVAPTIGFNEPFDHKKHLYKNFLFDINNSAKDTTVYYFKFKTNLVNCFLFKIRPLQSLINYSITEYSILSFYYGILFLMAIYNLMIYLRVKERVYLYYVGYVLGCSLYSLAEDGLGFQFFWPEHPAVNHFIVKWIADLLLIFFMLYSISFLNLHKTHKKVVYTILVLTVLHIVLNYLNFEFYYGQLNLRWIYLLPFTIIYILGLYKTYQGEKHIRFFVIGYSFILLSLVIFYLRTLGILVLHWVFYIYGFNIGFVLEVIVLSYALGERLRLEKLEKENAQQNMIAQLKENEELRKAYTSELEQKVRERTKDLEDANEEIKVFNEFLEIKNLKLERDVIKISKERATSKLISLKEFKEVYIDDETCKEFLSELKWRKKPYKCRKCGSEKDMPHERFYKRCASCKYVESATAHTIFHGVKIELPEALYILYAVYTHKDISPEELSLAVSVSEKSCAAFKKKIQELDKSIKPKQKKDGWEYLIEVS